MLLVEISQKDVRELLSSFILHLVHDDSHHFGWLSKYRHDILRASDDAVVHAIDLFDTHSGDMGGLVMLMGLIGTAVATRSMPGTRSTLAAIAKIHHPLVMQSLVSRWQTAAITGETQEWRFARKDAASFLNQVRVLLVAIKQAFELRDDSDELTRSLARGILNHLGLLNS